MGHSLHTGGIIADIELSFPSTRSVQDMKAALTSEIATRLPGGRIKRSWEGDVMRLVGMGADGRIEILPGQIRARVELKPPLSFMKGRVEQGLRETLELAAA